MGFLACTGDHTTRSVLLNHPHSHSGALRIWPAPHLPPQNAYYAAWVRNPVCNTYLLCVTVVQVYSVSELQFSYLDNGDNITIYLMVLGTIPGSQ